MDRNYVSLAKSMINPDKKRLDLGYTFHAFQLIHKFVSSSVFLSHVSEGIMWSPVVGKRHTTSSIFSSSFI